MTVHHIRVANNQANNQQANSRNSCNSRSRNFRSGSSNYILLAARQVDHMLDRVRLELVNLGELYFIINIFKHSNTM